MSPKLLAAAALTFNAFLYGVSWWPFRALQDQGLHPLWSTAIIYAFAVLCLVLLRPRACATSCCTQSFGGWCSLPDSPTSASIGR